MSKAIEAMTNGTHVSSKELDKIAGGDTALREKLSNLSVTAQSAYQAGDEKEAASLMKDALRQANSLSKLTKGETIHLLHENGKQSEHTIEGKLPGKGDYLGDHQGKGNASIDAHLAAHPEHATSLVMPHAEYVKNEGF